MALPQKRHSLRILMETGGRNSCCPRTVRQADKRLREQYRSDTPSPTGQIRRNPGNFTPYRKHRIGEVTVLASGTLMAMDGWISCRRAAGGSNHLRATTVSGNSTPRHSVGKVGPKR